MLFDVAFYSERGGRTVNEDAVTAAAAGGKVFAIAADGLGGMGNGEAASRDAAAYLPGLLQYPMDEDRLCDAIQEENRRILAMHTEGKQMMTTIAALWAEGSQALTATVGDTRIYQFRAGQIVFQSVDHSVAQLQVFSGKITQAQLRSCAEQNQLLRALGSEDAAQPELNELHIEPGDRFLLCTDGFWKLVVEEEMLHWGAADTAQLWLQRMQALSFSRCGPHGDNHSAIAIIAVEE